MWSDGGRTLGWVAVLIMGVSTGCKKPAPKGPPPLEVVVQRVQPTDVPVYFELVGTIDGFENAEIRARTAGYVEGIHYQEGGEVKKGDLLFTIDPVQASASVTSAAGSLADARAALAKANADVARYRPLVASNAISQQELDHAVAAQQAAKAAVLAQQGAVASAKATLGYTQVTAPIDGVAGIAQVRVGNLVGQGDATLLTTVSTLDPARVRFAIPEQQYIELASRLRELQNDLVENPDRPGHLELILADGSVYPQRGKVGVIQRQIDQRTGTLTIEAFFPNPDRTLRPGQYGKVRGQVEVQRGVMLVPQRAVRELQGGHQMGVVGGDGKVEMRTVTAGRRMGSNWVIEKGLKAGDQVIVEGLVKVRSGDTVRTKEIPAVKGPKALSYGDGHGDGDGDDDGDGDEGAVGSPGSGPDGVAAPPKAGAASKSPPPAEAAGAR